MHDVSDQEAAAGETIAETAASDPPRKRGNKKGHPRPSIAREFPGIADDDVLLTAEEVGVFFGGAKRPIDLATIYRLAAQSIVPLPVKVGPRSVRWLRSECREAREKMARARGLPAYATAGGTAEGA